MRTTKTVLVFALFLVLTSCADVSPHVQECVTSQSYGFWSGLWHGFIAPLSFFGSLFSNDIAFYAYDNNGGWYNFGFVIGAGILGFGSSKSSK